MIEVINLCVTVIAYAPDSFRSVEMLVSIDPKQMCFELSNCYYCLNAICSHDIVPSCSSVYDITDVQ